MFDNPMYRYSMNTMHTSVLVFYIVQIIRIVCWCVIIHLQAKRKNSNQPYSVNYSEYPYYVFLDHG